MDNAVKNKLDSFSDQARIVLLDIRAAILELAGKNNIGQIAETLKWGDPSYLSKNGSTVRLGWRPKSPDYVSVYLNCNTLLVETFKEIYPDTFSYGGNREIKLKLSGSVSMSALMSCVSMSLRYHKIKHLRGV